MFRSWVAHLLVVLLAGAGCWSSTTAAPPGPAVGEVVCKEPLAAPTGPIANPTGLNADGICTPPPALDPVVGWAAVPGTTTGTISIATTTGGEGGPTLMATTLAEFNAAAAGSTPGIVEVMGVIVGSLRVGSNKTIVGLCGGEIQGHIQLSTSVNVIVRNLKIVGYNCMDANAVSSRDCSAGADAVTISNNSHHVWFDHDDIADGSDGNLDINQGSDNITISWTKFHYTTQRVDPAGAGGGHRFSDLIGSSDGSANTDLGHLNVTFHHDWWAENSFERMPRVRFGKIHLFNNLWTSTGNSYCVGLGVSANILADNNAFEGVNEPFNINDFINADSVLQSTDNLFKGTLGNTRGLGGAAFVPPYDYFPDDVCGIPDAIQRGAGPQ